jgi:hypothetical protein
MSSQFNYELDERQIRLMMKDEELEHSDAMWHKFEQMSVTQSKASANIGNYMPSINLSVSRSVVVPVIFIVLIGGLSAMLFSFVDFKKKEAIEKEIPYVATIKPTKPAEAPLKPAIKKNPIVSSTITTLPKVDTVIPSQTNSVTIVSNNAPNEKEQKAKVIESKPQEIVSSKVIVPKKTTEVHSPKKKKKVKTEVLPIINATAPNLNEGVSEPELDLK